MRGNLRYTICDLSGIMPPVWMIVRPTTLILGAGASAPFGFPTGYGLLQSVLSLVDDRLHPIATELTDKFPKEFIHLFRETLLKSGKGSVDAFLEHRPEFMDIGKLSIALTLIPCENEERLFARNGNNWYEYLFNHLNTSFDDFGKNKLSVLTFNYDRSLEHYLFTALKNAYGKHGHEAAEKMKSIPIVHLHGDLGEIPYGSNTAGRFYSPEFSAHSLQLAAQRIKIVHEGGEEDSQFIHARKILSDSDLICFLGFGYYELNLKRLGFSVNNRQPPPYQKAGIHGSTYGLSGAERNYAAGLLSGRLHLNNLTALNMDVLPYLRETGFILSAKRG